MDLKPAFVSSKEEPKKSEGSVLNMSFFMNENNKDTKLNVDYHGESNATSEKKKKTTTRKKKTENGNNIVKVDSENNGDLSMHETNTPYNETYNETTNLLKSSIVDIDLMQNELRNDIDAIRNSKTIKKKYDYISEIASTRGSLINTKITAIREINNAITNSHNLELKRIKELKLNEDNKDDDKYIMDMYNAFISTPIGTRQMDMRGPSMNDLTLGGSNIVKADIRDNNYNTFMNEPMSPTAHMMRLESNPNIKTVVMYDSTTGNRWFDVIDTTTGASVPNSDKPDPMFLEDTTLDLQNNVARNTNLDVTYPIIVINNTIMNEY